MAFSATHAAFEGFRLIGRRPWSVLLWSLVSLVACAALVGGAVALAWPTLSEFSDRKDEVLGHAELMHFMGPLALAFAIVLPLGLLLNGVMLAALFRALLRPEERGFGYLKLGGDELRQVAVLLLQMLLGAVVVGVPLVAVRFGLDGATGEAGPAYWAAVIAGTLLGFGLLVWTSVRLSLAAPMTFAARRVRFFASWSLTRRRFWPLFGMYLLALVLSLIVTYVGSLVADAVLAAFGGSIHHHFDSLPDLSLVTPTLGAGVAAYVVLQVVLSTVQYVISYAPMAAAWSALRAERDGV